MLTTQTVVFRLSLELSQDSLARRRDLLSKDELAKADRFIVPRPRIQYIACRSALRILVASQLGCQPTEVCFEYQRLGKPQIDIVKTGCRDQAKSLHFNVSHSGQWGLIALSQAPVGVDLEKLQPRINAKSLMSQVVSQTEQAQWQNLGSAQHSEQIIRLWVCKEALLKAMGLGIAECLQQVSFQLPIPSSQPFAPGQIDPSVQIHLEESADCRRNSWLLPNSWQVQPLSIDPDYFAAVVTSQNCSTVELREFDEEALTSGTLN
jgi:4'-phosphopantetheinyl transferase